MNKNNLILRYVFFFLGLAVNSFGIAFITKSALGTSPISSVPYVCSLFFEGISFGAFTFIVNKVIFWFSLTTIFFSFIVSSTSLLHRRGRRNFRSSCIFEREIISYRRR